MVIGLGQFLWEAFIILIGAGGLAFTLGLMVFFGMRFFDYLDKRFPIDD